MKKYIGRIIPCVVLLLMSVLLVFAVNGIFKVGSFIKQTAEPVTEVVPETTEAQTEESTTSVDEFNNSTFTVIYPAEAQITVTAPVITVSGTYNTDYPLTINGNAVNVSEDGSFNYDCELTPGENTITVANSVKTAVYKVIYDLQVISAVSPSKNMSVDGGMVLEISADILAGSSAYAVINGTTVSLSASDEGGQFVKYYGTYTIPAASSEAVSLGRVKFYADYNGYKASKQGGRITVNAYKAEDIVIEQGAGQVVAPEITGDDVVNVLSPNTDHGKGSAYMLRINADYAETVPASTADDKSDPRYTPEIKGTIDYIKSEVNYEGTAYYITLSGVKVEKKYATAFNGFVMPTNTISAYKSYTSNGYTNAILTMNWKVPFNSEMKDQSYYRGYSGRVFNVSAFTASYIDFTFKFTNAAEGSFDFSSSSVVSSAEWVNVGKDGTTTLRVHFRAGGKFYGYRAYYSNDNRLVLQFNEKPSASGATVVLDPGHGGHDCGAIGVNGTYESSINLRIAGMVKQNLEQAGYRVIILRTSDVYLSLDDRQAAARRAGGDIFVAIHCNSSTSSKLSGTEVYYYRAMSKGLASSIHSRLASTWRGVYSNNPSMQNKVVASDGGVRFYPFRVTRLEECPAVLVECGYLSNPTECSMLCNSGVQSNVAGAISGGIADYFNSL